MKYLTKEWYELSQQMGLHFDMRAHKEASVKDEKLYQRLYKRKEKQFVEEEREIYNIDPRYLLEQDGMNLVPLNKIHNNEEISEEDVIVHQLSDEERSRIEKLIAEYDARPPFDEEGCKQVFRKRHEWRCRYVTAQLPKQILSQIADIRVYALGYCTKEVLTQLKRLSKENKQKVNQMSEAAYKELQQQQIPASLLSKLNFHDCRVTSMETGNDVTITFETSGGFTEDNKMTLVEAQMILQEDGIIGSYWLYNELYRVEQGYELHVLLSGQELCELIVQCKDIVIEKQTAAIE